MIHFTHHDTDIELIQHLQQRNLLVRMLICTILFCIGLIITDFYQLTTVKNPKLFLNVLGCLFMFIAIGFLIQGLIDRRKNASALTAILINAPQTVVWVYHYVVVNQPYGIELVKMTTLYFNLLDGSRRELTLPLNKVDELLTALKNRLPHATFGHNDKKEFLYRADPKLLLK